MKMTKDEWIENFYIAFKAQCETRTEERSSVISELREYAIDNWGYEEFQRLGSIGAKIWTDELLNNH